MSRKRDNLVRLRAGGVCEYCRLPESISALPFPIDHIVARQHGGSDDESHLALACPECNLHKGPNIAGLDPLGGALTRLYHPRRDRWLTHFCWQQATMVGLTDVGRTTAYVIGANSIERHYLRLALIRSGIFPRDSLDER